MFGWASLARSRLGINPRVTHHDIVHRQHNQCAEFEFVPNLTKSHNIQGMGEEKPLKFAPEESIYQIPETTKSFVDNYETVRIMDPDLGM